MYIVHISMWDWQCIVFIHLNIFFQDLGVLEMAVAFHASAQKLQLTVERVRHLPKYCLTGAPGNYSHPMLLPLNNVCQNYPSQGRRNTKISLYITDLEPFKLK